MDINEYKDIVFMGLPVEDSYKSVDKLRQHLSDFGVNMDGIIGGEIDKVYSKERMLEMLKDQLSTLD
jgi:hypothetical protein